MTTLLNRESRPTVGEVSVPTYRKTAVLVGVLFIVGTAAGVASEVVGGWILSSTDFLAEAAAGETALITGGLLVLLMGFPLAMVPVVMYPLFRRHNETLAQGAIVFRGVLEAIIYVLMALVMFAAATVGKEFVDAGGVVQPRFELWSGMLLESSAWLEVMLAIVFAIGSIMMSWLFVRTGLIPNWLALWGLLGSVLYLVAPFVVMYSIESLELSLTTRIGFLLGPLAIQEMVFGVWVLVKGFKPEAVRLLVH